MARKRIFIPTIDERIVSKLMEIHGCNREEAWTIHKRYLISNGIAA